MGVFARAFRRAELPVRMSLGFNPRPRFSLPAPLPVGIDGLDEVLEMDLIEAMPADELAQRLSAEMPDGIEILRAEIVEPPARGRVASATYDVAGDLPPGAVERCSAAEKLPVTRADGRRVNIALYLNRVESSDRGCEFDLLVTAAGSARPAEVCAALCAGDPALLRHLSLTRTTVSLVAPERN